MNRSTSDWILIAFAAGNLANAVWMLASPEGWYHGLPAGVPHTGPLNEHFVRDIGSAFAVMALALFWAAFRRDLRFPMLVLVTAFYTLHALVHVFDTLRGALPPAHWAIDFPAVYLSALVLLVTTGRLATRT